ncbi:hypothetical protein AWENTII_012609 [Aspergillus wentii]
MRSFLAQHANESHLLKSIRRLMFFIVPPFVSDYFHSEFAKDIPMAKSEQWQTYAVTQFQFWTIVLYVLMCAQSIHRLDGLDTTAVFALFSFLLYSPSALPFDSCSPTQKATICCIQQ